jgi:hypothetical protein
MYRRLVVALALAASAHGALAQTARDRDEPLRVRLARARELLAQMNARDSMAKWERGRELRAVRFDAGPLSVVLPATANGDVGRRIAKGAFRALEDLGAIPQDFVASRVAVSLAATGVDSLLRASGLGARATVAVDLGRTPDTLADDWKVAVAIAQAYGRTLDSEWRTWLPWDLGVDWKWAREGESSVRALMAGETLAGGRCLEGDARECRLWLGLDRDANPFVGRFRPAELRRLAAGRWFPPGSEARLAKQCGDGSDDACVQLASAGNKFSPIPAGYDPRNSLTRAVRVLHGPDALRRALADTAGSVGERLARAARISEDSLVTEWRAWLLTGGGHARVSADVGAAMPSLVFAGLLLFAAARSGRWR